MDRLAVLVRLLQWCLQLVAGFGGGYLALLTGATYLKRAGDPNSESVKPRFAVVVPAHNEERTIGKTLHSLEWLSYPPESYGVFVVADNCQDSTAEVARGFRCIVWERVEPEHKAKGYALEWSFERLPEGYDAVVIVDADAVVAPTFLTELARVYQPSYAMQALNLQSFDSSAASAASYVASALQNCLKPWGRENLGCSVGLNGIGMCIPLTLLDELHWAQSSLAEDVEYHSQLVLAGKSVRFVPEARVKATSPGKLRSLQSQRLRWERGRLDLLGRLATPLLSRAVRRRDVKAFEASISIVAPPLNLTVSAAVGCGALGLARRSPAGLAFGALGLFAPAAATFRALNLVGAPPRIYAYLFLFPPFIVWRTYISLRSLLSSKGGDWVRTERPGERT